ncbi:MAG: aminoglycoside phosphotransferase family protein [Gemmatimonadota bacterium]
MPELFDEGWDNVTYRIGRAHAVRLPRRAIAAELLANEQRWLPSIETWIDVPVPTPVFEGMPSDLFRWPWSVVPWIDGEPLELRSLDRGSARRLAAALLSLHRPASTDMPLSEVRGIPLATLDARVSDRLRRLSAPHLEEAWGRALGARPEDQPVLLHGDIHPRNVVVHRGMLAGLIDWGDLCAGDRATDVACAWTLFDATTRDDFLDAYRPSGAERLRALGWAIHFGTALQLSGEPRHVAMGDVIVSRIEEDLARGRV